MKNCIYTVIALMLVGMFGSCEQEIDFAYEGKGRIHFQHFQLDWNKNRLYFDSVIYSFGLKSPDILIDTAKIAMEHMGENYDTERTYKIRIDTDSTTAIEGVHYETLNTIQTFRPGKLTDTLRIVLYRKSLNNSFTNPVDERLDLILEPSDDFDLGLAKGHRMKLLFNNYLCEPTWWYGNFRGGLNYYHPKKWQILISFNEKFANAASCPFDQNNEGRGYITGLTNYLKGVPTFDDETGDRIYMDKMVPVE